MKRVLFPQAYLFLNVLIICFVFSNCKKQNSDVSGSGIPEEIATSKAGAKPGTLPEVLVKLTVNSAGNNVTSDGNDDYINGSQNVSAKIDQYGNLIFGIGSSGHGPGATPDRWLNYNFSNPLPGYSARS